MDACLSSRTFHLAGDDSLSAFSPQHTSQRSSWRNTVLDLPKLPSMEEVEESIRHKPRQQHYERQQFHSANHRDTPPLTPTSKDSPEPQEVLYFPRMVLPVTMSNKRKRNNERMTTTTGQIKHKMDERSRRKKSQLLTEWLEGSIPPAWVDMCKQFAFETCKATINTKKAPAKNVIAFYAVTWNRYMRVPGDSQGTIDTARACEIIRATDKQLQAEETDECPLEEALSLIQIRKGEQSHL